MPSGGPAAVDALRASLLELAMEPDEGLAHQAELANARRRWAAHCAAFGLVLLDDHDPHVAPGLHVARSPGPLAVARLRQLGRSWETFDRAFEACPPALERVFFDEHIARCFVSLGIPLAHVDLAQDHLFVIDERYVASFPAERWNEHAARHVAPESGDRERLMCALRRVTAAGD